LKGHDFRRVSEKGIFKLYSETDEFARIKRNPPHDSLKRESFFLAIMGICAPRKPQFTKTTRCSLQIPPEGHPRNLHVQKRFQQDISFGGSSKLYRITSYLVKSKNLTSVILV